MIDRDKVIKGLECCAEDCVDGCPYEDLDVEGWNCTTLLCRDALELLKAQEPRVLTLEEVKAAKGSTVWLERSFGIGYETAIAPIEITGIGTGGISFYFGNEDYRAYGHPVYGCVAGHRGRQTSRGRRHHGTEIMPVLQCNGIGGSNNECGASNQADR